MTLITRDNIVEHMFNISDAKYKEFHGGLVPGNNTIIGVRVPVLRSYAKELLKENDAQTLLDLLGEEWYEERMLQGMIIGLQRGADLQTVLGQTESFLDRIDNWAVCDTFCAGLKLVKKHREEVFDWLMQFVEAQEEYKRRFVLVMLLDYYIDDEYIERVFNIVDKIPKEEYYVQMAAAWALSVALVKKYDRTLAYMENCRLDDFTYNKALQKAVESYRITDQQKAELRSRKRRKD